MRTKGIDLSGIDNAVVAQLIAAKYAIDSAGRVKVEPKDDARLRPWALARRRRRPPSRLLRPARPGARYPHPPQAARRVDRGAACPGAGAIRQPVRGALPGAWTIWRALRPRGWSWRAARQPSLRGSPTHQIGSASMRSLDSAPRARACPGLRWSPGQLADIASMRSSQTPRSVRTTTGPTRSDPPAVDRTTVGADTSNGAYRSPRPSAAAM